MARAAFAAKAQLIARLRPHVAHAVGSASGTAPLELLPEVCSVLRSLTPAELRLTLAAYSGYPDIPELRLRPSNVGADAGSTSGVRLPDVLVQLLVGGSRLGTTSQLLDAADALARHAPCGCEAAVEFWTVFAERVGRLSASNNLSAQELLRILAACDGWRDRCGVPLSRRMSGGAWGHMLRSAGGRLADPKHLDALELQEVVAVLRHAARLGEPQARLAAAAGLRVGSNAEHISASDLVDLIGAAGKLGGRLHMMTRALADQLEPQVPVLPAHQLLQLCTHLGTLEMFPQRVASALEAALPSRLREFDLRELLLLFRSCGRLRWRLPTVLEPLLDVVRDEQHLESMSGATLGAVLYELYRLDLWDESLTNAVCTRLDRDSGRVVPRKTAANVLLALAYFSHPAPDLCAQLVKELARAQDLPLEAIYQIKTFEMAVRVGHAAVTFDDLGKLASRWLFGMRKATTAPEQRSESAFADEVSAVARSISWRHETEIEVGPYLLDFAAVAEPDEEDAQAAQDPNNRALARFCVALEADGPSHFYRPHGRPWHWTSSSKLRHRLLTSAGIRVAHVPHYDWLQLSTTEEKEAYLAEVLLHAHQQAVGGPWQRAAAGARASNNPVPRFDATGLALGGTLMSSTTAAATAR